MLLWRLAGPKSAGRAGQQAGEPGKSSIPAGAKGSPRAKFPLFWDTSVCFLLRTSANWQVIFILWRVICFIQHVLT